jgi:hypothetical protein
MKGDIMYINKILFKCINTEIIGKVILTTVNPLHI